MEKLDGGFVFLTHEGIKDFIARGHGAHRDCSVGEAPLGHRNHVRRDTELLSRESVPSEPAEARYDLIENQQDAVASADFTQSFEITLWRQQNTRRAGHMVRR